MWGNGIINIGSRTHIGENSWIYANISGGVTLGNDVNCAANLYIIDTDHVYQGAGTINSHGYISKFIEIGNNVWIGANVTILKGTIIRDRTVIGACSLCNKEYNGNKIIAEFQQKKLKIFKTTLLYISLIYN